jgi:Na+/proline symporter
MGSFGTIAGIFFLLGITASSYASADSALAALTTGFCVDFLNFYKRDEKQKKRLQLFVHIGFSLLFLLIILGTEVYISKNPGSDLIGTILKIASYTYGPLLGLFTFGIFTKRQVRDKFSLIICLTAPSICYLIATNSENWFLGYKFGYELLILNGLLTFIGLWIISLGVPNKEGQL